ncbi:hypothetical protein V3C99_009532 [Haemonchus contortus]|uniref:Transposase n=2 Tax=Haemonchus TaxID=6288 RepID=A0A0N4WWA0_HAEPC|nr:unnamed protein product [Haemonchus placei]
MASVDGRLTTTKGLLSSYYAIVLVNRVWEEPKAIGDQGGMAKEGGVWRRAERTSHRTMGRSEAKRVRDERLKAAVRRQMSQRAADQLLVTRRSTRGFNHAPDRGHQHRPDPPGP